MAKITETKDCERTFTLELTEDEAIYLENVLVAVVQPSGELDTVWAALGEVLGGFESPVRFEIDHPVKVRRIAGGE